jgi:prepilin-type N-terminal cleavage/methylation domain-containing protein
VRSRAGKGFTMIEMTASLVVVSIIILAIAGVVTDSYTIWEDLYESVYGVNSQSVITVQRTFNKTCRKATLRNLFLSTDRQSMCLYYFDDYENPGYWPDRYALFYLDGSDLKVQHGTLHFATLLKNQSLYTETLCSNVEYIKFSMQGLSVQMCMTISNNGKKKTFAWASVRHN